MLKATYISLLEKIGSWVFINTRGLSFIDGVYSFFGIQGFALLTLGIILYLRIKKTDNRAIKIPGVILYIIVFIYFFPYFAAIFETQRVLFFEKENGDMIEGFNMLYVLFRFPTYWLCGLSIPFLGKIKRKKYPISNDR